MELYILGRCHRKSPEGRWARYAPCPIFQVWRRAADRRGAAPQGKFDLYVRRFSPRLAPCVLEIICPGLLSQLCVLHNPGVRAPTKNSALIPVALGDKRGGYKSWTNGMEGPQLEMSKPAITTGQSYATNTFPTLTTVLPRIPIAIEQSLATQRRWRPPQLGGAHQKRS